MPPIGLAGWADLQARQGCWLGWPGGIAGFMGWQAGWDSGRPFQVGWGPGGWRAIGLQSKEFSGAN